MASEIFKAGQQEMKAFLCVQLLRKIFQTLFVLLASLQLIGGPYSVMQVVAWSTMLVNYSKQDGILQATKDTFSGEKPCELCRKIQLAQSVPTEHESPAPPPSALSLKQFQEMLPAKELILPSPRSSLIVFSQFLPARLSRGIAADAPLVPPPCLAA